MASSSSTANNPTKEPVRDYTGFDDDERKVLKNYRLLRKLQKGGYGTVYLACYTEIGAKVALKVQNKARVGTRKEKIVRAFNEFTVQRALASPFIIELISAFHTKNRLFLVLEYASGGDFTRFLNRTGPFVREYATFYLAEMLLGIRYLHRNGVAHRDLKTDNILLSEEGHVKICDLGLSKAGMVGNQRTKTICGTIPFAAPDIFGNQGYTKGVDVWSFGIIMMQMMTGTLLVCPKVPQAEYARLITEMVITEKTLPLTRTDEGSANLIRKSLQKEASRPTVQELMMDEYFTRFDWDAAEKRQLKPPCVPVTTDHDYTYPLLDPVKPFHANAALSLEGEGDPFQAFTYTNSNFGFWNNPND